MSRPDARVRDRARGALIGLAVGDALGTTLEFSERDRNARHTERTGGGPFHLDAGVWTDDTSMALALADSLLSCRGFDASDLMKRFVRWWQDGDYSATGACFDIGITTRHALQRFLGSGNPCAGDTREDTAGNGSLMRLSPVALHALYDPEACRRIAAGQSRTTHGAPQALQACMLLADKLRRAILGESRTAILAAESWNGQDAIAAIAAAEWRGRTRDEIQASGYVVHTLEAALWAVSETSNFEDAVILAVNLGDDADTIGAVTGQLAGALYGYSAIPERWLACLAWHKRIIDTADALLIPG